MLKVAHLGKKNAIINYHIRELVPSKSIKKVMGNIIFSMLEKINKGDSKKRKNVNNKSYMNLIPHLRHRHRKTQYIHWILDIKSCHLSTTNLTFQ